MILKSLDWTFKPAAGKTNIYLINHPKNAQRIAKMRTVWKAQTSPSSTDFQQVIATSMSVPPFKLAFNIQNYQNVKFLIRYSEI